jgi:hypothetical protein
MRVVVRIRFERRALVALVPIVEDMEPNTEFHNGGSFAAVAPLIGRCAPASRKLA